MFPKGRNPRSSSALILNSTQGYLGAQLSSKGNQVSARDKGKRRIEARPPPRPQALHSPVGADAPPPAPTPCKRRGAAGTYSGLSHSKAESGAGWSRGRGLGAPFPGANRPGSGYKNPPPETGWG